MTSFAPKDVFFGRGGGVAKIGSIERKIHKYFFCTWLDCNFVFPNATTVTNTAI